MSERGFWLLMIAVGVAIPLGSELRRLLRSVRHPNEPPEPGRAYTLLLAAIGFAGLMATISTPLVYDEGPSASRMVAGPGMYPPKDFKAYGIVAFHTRPTGDDKSRFEIICNAYVSALLYYRDVKSPLEKQVV